MSPVYVKCRMLPGLFDQELYVLINGSSSAYVRSTLVFGLSGSPTHETEVDGRVFGYLIKKNETESLIELMGEPIVGGLRTWVPNTQVSAEA